MAEQQLPSKLYELSGQEVSEKTAESLAREEYLEELKRTTRVSKRELSIEVESADKETSKEFLLAKQSLDKVLQLRAQQLKELTLPERVDSLVAEYRKSPEEWQKKIEKSGMGLASWAMRGIYSQAAENLGITKASGEKSNKEALLAAVKSGQISVEDALAALDLHLEETLQDERFDNDVLKSMLTSHLDTFHLKLTSGQAQEEIRSVAAPLPPQEAGETLSMPADDLPLDETPEQEQEMPLAPVERTAIPRGEYQTPIELGKPETLAALKGSLERAFSAEETRYAEQYNALSPEDQKDVDQEALYRLHLQYAQRLADNFLNQSVGKRYQSLFDKYIKKNILEPDDQEALENIASFHSVLEAIDTTKAMTSPEDFGQFALELKNNTPGNPPELQQITAELLTLLAWQRGGCSVISSEQAVKASTTTFMKREFNPFLAKIHSNELFGPKVAVLQQPIKWEQLENTISDPTPPGDIQYLTPYVSSLLDSVDLLPNGDPTKRESSYDRKAFDYRIALASISPELLPTVVASAHRNSSDTFAINTDLSERLGIDVAYTTRAIGYRESREWSGKHNRTPYYKPFDLAYQIKYGGNSLVLKPRLENNAYLDVPDYNGDLSPLRNEGPVVEYAESINTERIKAFRHTAEEQISKASAALIQLEQEQDKGTTSYAEQREHGPAFATNRSANVISLINESTDRMERIFEEVRDATIKAQEALRKYLATQKNPPKEISALLDSYNNDPRELLNYQVPGRFSFSGRQEKEDLEQKLEQLRRAYNQQMRQFKNWFDNYQKSKIEDVNKAGFSSGDSPDWVALRTLLGKQRGETLTFEDFTQLTRLDRNNWCPDVSSIYRPETNKNGDVTQLLKFNPYSNGGEFTPVNPKDKTRDHGNSSHEQKIIDHYRRLSTAKEALEGLPQPEEDQRRAYLPSLS